MLASRSGELTAFDAKSGKRAWPADLPKNCRTTGAVSFTVGTAVAIRASCPRSSYGDDTVPGIDRRSGAVRWHCLLHTAALPKLPLDGDEEQVLDPWVARDGVVAVGRSGMFTNRDPDLAVIGG
ncbi:PQQ-binding-like beta-propeller repeat protein [Streptomyces sp. NPDC005393]|uniref:outer membrane protein assembly factor BamB family protein n=1 Tax=Streptomyces sp. NPDC005393 TaxID=3157041 RepID=UPI0033A7ED82